MLCWFCCHINIHDWQQLIGHITVAQQCAVHVIWSSECFKEDVAKMYAKRKAIYCGLMMYGMNRGRYLSIPQSNGTQNPLIKRLHVMHFTIN